MYDFDPSIFDLRMRSMTARKLNHSPNHPSPASKASALFLIKGNYVTRRSYVNPLVAAKAVHQTRKKDFGPTDAFQPGKAI